MQIEVSHLVKEYKRKKNPENMLAAVGQMFRPKYEILRAVNDINFGIEKGEAVGYVGPNGCGKSTTIKMLSGVLRRTSPHPTLRNGAGNVPASMLCILNRCIGPESGVNLPPSGE